MSFSRKFFLGPRGAEKIRIFCYGHPRGSQKFFFRIKLLKNTFKLFSCGSIFEKVLFEEEIGKTKKKSTADFNFLLITHSKNESFHKF